MLLLIALLAVPALRVRRTDVILGAVAFTAAYCLLAFRLMADYNTAIPGFVPLSAIWLLAFIALFAPREKRESEPAELAPSSPTP